MAEKLPKQIATRYYKDMLVRIKMMEKISERIIQEKIIPKLIKFEEEVNKEAELELRTNASIFGGLSTRLQQLFTITQTEISIELAVIQNEVQKVFDFEFSKGISKKFVDSINVTDKKNIGKSISSVLGSAASEKKLKAIDVLSDRNINSIVQTSIDKNIELIQSIPQEYSQKLNDTIYDGLSQGKSAKSIGKEIADIGGVSERRGQFIARDQLGTVYGDMTKKRQENLGIKKFNWITSKDERVRESHRKLDGKTFDWLSGAQGPEVDAEVMGLVPGEDYNCRCTSSPDEQDIWDLLDRLEDGEE